MRNPCRVEKGIPGYGRNKMQSLKEFDRCHVGIRKEENKMSRIVVSVIGAGGKMGTRTSNNLAKKPDVFELLLVEATDAGIQSIRDRGFEPTPVEEALAKADVVVFAVPDTLIGKLSAIYVPQLKPGTGFIILDPAAAVARELTLREDCTFGVAHPCHPSYFLDQDTFEARQDRFGGMGGKQDIVMSKIQGDDQRFEIGRAHV